MAIDFPTSPATNDTYTYNGKTYSWNGDAWVGVSTVFGSGVAAFLATPSSANLKTALTDETGSGANVFADGPQMATIELGHSTDTTLARSAAGIVTVEGTPLKKAGRETIWIPAGAMRTRTTNGAALGTLEMTTNKNMFNTYDFDTTTQEFVQFEIHFPKSWDLGTVTFQPVWSHPSTVTNFGVVWQLAGIARSNDDAGDVAFGTEQTSTDTGGTTNDIYLAPESAAITIAGTPAVEDTVQFQLARVPANGSDTMAVDARLHGIRLFFTTNAATDL